VRTLVLGGVRSGKSAFAERLASAYAASRGAEVQYVATLRRGDPELAARIARHRARRPSTWHTVEGGEVRPEALPDLIGRLPPAVLLLDCLSLWVASAVEAFPASAAEEDFIPLVDRLSAAFAAHRGDLVVVSLEAGTGLVPLAPTARRFVDWLGLANQRLAASVERVALVVAGLPVWLKGDEGA
jgi:adenosylcobinamide kinase/adenosylcobinamide-phosphate guanylyltransferase